MPEKPEFAGMTVNERLFVADLLQAWDASIRTRNRSRMIHILKSVDMGDEAAITADAVLADPEKYGH